MENQRDRDNENLNRSQQQEQGGQGASSDYGSNRAEPGQGAENPLDQQQAGQDRQPNRFDDENEPSSGQQQQGGVGSEPGREQQGFDQGRQQQDQEESDIEREENEGGDQGEGDIQFRSDN